MNNTILIEGINNREYIFFSLKDPIRTIYGLLDSFVLIFGVSMNLLLIYLIKTKTATGMEIYKKLLYISCFMDLIVSFWTFIVQPIPCISHGYRTILINGIFRNSSQPIRYAVYLMWIQLMLIFLCTTITQYVYRYCILCKNGIISIKLFGTLIFTQITLFFAHGSILTWADYPRKEELILMEEIKTKVIKESGLTDVEFISFVNARAFRWLLHVIVMLIILPGFYIIVCICMIKIRKVVQQMNTLKLKEYSLQVSAALLFQALLPSFEAISWTIQTFVPVLITEGNTVLYTVFTDIPTHLIPALNPIGTILLVAPYRRIVFRYFGISKVQTKIIRIQTTIQAIRRRTVSIHPTYGN